MDITILRSLATVLAAAALVGIALWAYSDKRKAEFDAAAQLPFADDDNETDVEERKS